ERGSGRRPLEQQMLEEMARAADRGCLVARARQHPEPDRRGTHPRHPFRDDPKARGELGPADGHPGRRLLAGGSVGARRSRRFGSAGRATAEPASAAATPAIPAATTPVSTVAAVTAPLAGASLAGSALVGLTLRDRPLLADRLQADLALSVDVFDEDGDLVA